MSILTDMQSGYYNQNPVAAFNYAFGPQLAKNNPFASWLGSKQGDYFGRYQGMLGVDPSQGTDHPFQFLEFLQGLNPEQEFGAMAPRQRGENQGNFAPALRWLSSFGGR